MEGEGEEIEDEKDAELDPTYEREMSESRRGGCESERHGRRVGQGYTVDARRRTNSSSSARGPDDEKEDEDDAEATDDDVGDVSYRAIADSQDTALWVDANWGSGDIRGEAGENGGSVVAFDLVKRRREMTHEGKGKR